MGYEGMTYYLAYNQVGSLRAVSDTAGNVVKEVTYDTFGNILTDSNPAMQMPFGFAGGLYDEDTGLTRFGYRDYDAFTGKWTAKDPIGFAGGDTNLYGYVLGDPVNLIDSLGLYDDPRLNAAFGVPSTNQQIMQSIYDGYVNGLQQTNVVATTMGIAATATKQPKLAALMGMTAITTEALLLLAGEEYSYSKFTRDQLIDLIKAKGLYGDMLAELLKQYTSYCEKGN